MGGGYEYTFVFVPFVPHENNFSFVYNFFATESYVINFVYAKGMHIYYVIDDRA